jgi:DNA-binding transcriptional ArsR family regulator
VDTASAIGDPARREILQMLLRRGRLSAGSIAAAFDISRPAISRHLRVLREAGLVVDEAHGRERLYRLEVAPLRELSAWLAPFIARRALNLDALETEVYRTRRQRRTAAPPATREERPA